MVTRIINVKMRQITCDACGWVWTIGIDKDLPRLCYRCKSTKYNGDINPKPSPRKQKGRN